MQADEDDARDFSRLELLTPRLRLRPHHVGDVDALFETFSDPAVMRYWSTPPWSSREQALALVDRDLAGMARGEYLRLALERRDDGSLVGNACLFSFNLASRRAELGYGLARAAWGQGLAAEALTALLDYAFGPLGLHRVEADTDPRNTASMHLLQRLGFVNEGLLRERWIVGDEISDTALHGLLRVDWLARRDPR